MAAAQQFNPQGIHLEVVSYISERGSEYSQAKRVALREEVDGCTTAVVLSFPPQLLREQTGCRPQIAILHARRTKWRGEGLSGRVGYFSRLWVNKKLASQSSIFGGISGRLVF